MTKKTFKLKGDFIKLEQLLKVTNTVSSGGDAKVLILSEQVKVNGETETHRGKKIRVSDKVETSGTLIEVE